VPLQVRRRKKKGSARPDPPANGPNPDENWKKRGLGTVLVLRERRRAITLRHKRTKGGDSTAQRWEKLPEEGGPRRSKNRKWGGPKRSFRTGRWEKTTKDTKDHSGRATRKLHVKGELTGGKENNKRDAPGQRRAFLPGRNQRQGER